ncbi:methyltransferase domain-containing protein [Gilvimarinus sp. F26214L]|uniref:methyltransferase domain-containing protein n=1 Tax=Gilvimarinus sp. DZF01 TaxID=3461371 RepID=UPI004045B151
MSGLAELDRRSSEAELMDDASISFDEFHHCLRSLETINHLTLAYRPTLRWLRPWLRTGQPLRVLDVGSGGGDMLRQIESQARKEGHSQVDLVGVDLNPWSRRSALLSEADSQIRYLTGNVLDFEPDVPVDLVISSLFTHHLSDPQVVDFLRWMHGRARKGWFINDLHRHPLPYYFIRSATALLSRNRLIRNDAAVSVARSFTREDWQQLLQRAGIDGDIRIQWHFPFRICLSCVKNVAATHACPV